MVPIRALADIRVEFGPQSIVRYNNVRSLTVNGEPAPGRSSGDGLAAMERISATTLPQGFSFEWTGTAYQEKAASGQTGMILGLAVLFAFLFLVALYESWTIPVPVLLSVSVALLGAFAAVMNMSVTNVALPSIAAALDAEGSSIAWISDSFTIALTSFVLISGAVGDRYGRRLMFLLGALLVIPGVTDHTTVPHERFDAAAATSEQVLTRGRTTVRDLHELIDTGADLCREDPTR
jgi:hypothetical protein